MDAKKDPANPVIDLIDAGRDLKLVADGPLSKMFASALHELYKKEVDEATGIVLETQVLDEENYENLWIANKFLNQGKDMGMLYAVYEPELTLDDVARVSEALEQMTGEQRSKSLVLAITDERNASDGSRFRNYHYGDGFAQNISALYSHDQDWGVRQYRACNIAADSLKKLCEKTGAGYCKDLDEYVQWVKARVAQAEAPAC